LKILTDYLTSQFQDPVKLAQLKML